ncbi:polyketide cyclase, partial [Halobacteriales archaeon QS_9_67_17]
MREVEVSRFVAATPAAVERVLTPEGIVAAEGSFTVREVREAEAGTLV